MRSPPISVVATGSVPSIWMVQGHALNKPIAGRRTALAQAGRWRMLGGAATAAVMTFNLVCAGTVTTTSFAETKSAPYRSEYRVDLNMNRWCETDCKAIHTIAAVQPAQITLTEKKGEGRFDASVSNFINRETGAHFGLVRSGYGRSAVGMKYEGTCTPAPFTGFPDFKTKF
ncbi:hypothetical protein [Sphingomonas sanxanigenens]|uniref:hypothetical protein n=1 Tax=Sphingomonas sanxanigenens TaxID=397260 RepID=UPI001301501E|nr:hypothetical protein [Sphingomonas sanxanigenens]